MIFCIPHIDLFSALTSIGTLATAIVTGLMVWEIKKQRTNSYKPHLYIDKANFFVQGSQNENYFMASIWHDNAKSSAEPADFRPESTTYNSFYLKCYNIGFGTAKNVSINISYDIDEFIRQIKKLEKEISKEFIFDISNKENLLFITPLNNRLPYKGSGIGKKFGVDQSPIYILPANINQDFTAISLPLTFLELLNIYIFYRANMNPLQSKSEDIPLIRIEIKYMDISNKHATSIFNVATKIGLLGTLTYDGQLISTEGN